MKVIAVSKQRSAKGKAWKKTCTCPNCKAKLLVTYADLTLFDDRDGKAYRYTCGACQHFNWISFVTVGEAR